MKDTSCLRGVSHNFYLCRILYKDQHRERDAEHAGHNRREGYSLLLSIMVVFTLLSVAGCVTRQAPTTQTTPSQPTVADRLPALLDDPAFLRDLEQARQRGRGRVTVIAPSSGFAEKDVELVHALAQKANFSFPPHALDRTKIPYNANSDDVRLALLSDGLTNPDSDVLWAIRGGYGSSRLLDGLAKLPVQAQRKKILVGYSDITFLHLFLQKHGWQTVHGSVLWEMVNPKKDENNFRLLAGILSGRIRDLDYDGLRPRNKAARALRAPVRASLTGGNLTCLAAAVGSPWALDAAGKILVLEDVGEAGYRIDRMLTQLRQAGHFKGVRAIILGNFTTGDDNTEFALERFAAECRIPVFSTDIFGHGAKNYPLVFNAPAKLYKKSGTKDNFAIHIDAGKLP